MVEFLKPLLYLRLVYRLTGIPLFNLCVPDLISNLRYFLVILTPFTAVEKGLSFAIQVWK